MLVSTAVFTLFAYESNMKFLPLHESLGAVVENVNCNSSLNHQATALKDALSTWQILLFRGQALSDEAFVNFCRLFGELELLPEPEKRHPTYPEIFNLSNVKADGTLTAHDDPQAVFLRGTSRWHTDSSFREIPCLATVLYAVTVPPEEGDTEFANMVKAYQSLSAEEQHEAATMQAVHSYAYSRSANPGKLEEMSEEELAQVPDTVHPVVREHPDGRVSIYLGGHVSHFEGEDVAESRARVRAMEERLTQVKNVYRHQWQQGDLLIWDNRTTMHRLTGYAIDKYARVMRRCTVAGHEPVLPVGSYST
jgi:alpha-ketoglutarate-dependent taurine dioxygenase